MVVSRLLSPLWRAVSRVELGTLALRAARWAVRQQRQVDRRPHGGHVIGLTLRPDSPTGSAKPSMPSYRRPRVNNPPDTAA
jgi:hypothetical protein